MRRTRCFKYVGTESASGTGGEWKDISPSALGEMFWIKPIRIGWKLKLYTTGRINCCRKERSDKLKIFEHWQSSGFRESCPLEEFLWLEPAWEWQCSIWGLDPAKTIFRTQQQKTVERNTGRIIEEIIIFLNIFISILSTVIRKPSFFSINIL